jgi:ribosomal-protein-alanine N-acetyltransferase
MTTLPVAIRFVIRRDVPVLAAIDAASFAAPWNEPVLTEHIGQSHCVGLAAEEEGEVVAFVLYELQPARVVVLRLAVAPEFRRRGVGRQLIARLLWKVDAGRRTSLHLPVPERCLAAQLWLRALGIPCVRTLHAGDEGEATYLFRARRGHTLA